MAAWYLVPFVFVVDLVAVVAIALVLVVLHVFLVLRGAVRLCWREPPPISREVISRTPDDRFASISDFPFQPHYFTTGSGLRVHYVDEGPRDAAETVVCLHGEPTWSYLYRKMIPGLRDAGHRVLAMDFVGFGKSDKLTRVAAYSHTLHTATLLAWFVELDLRNVTLVVQDWGGLTGLSALPNLRGRVSKLCIMNTGLPPVGFWYTSPRTAANFLLWRTLVKVLDKRLNVATVMKWATGCSAAEAAAYGAPFHSSDALAGALAWPPMVPIDMPRCLRRAFAHMPFDRMLEAQRFLASWHKPTLVMFSDCPVSASQWRWFRDTIPSQCGQIVHVQNAGHFLQEQQGPRLATHIVRFMDDARTSQRGQSSGDASDSSPTWRTVAW